MAQTPGERDAFRDLIAEVIFEEFHAAPGELAIHCSKTTAGLIADLILERAQERGLVPCCQALVPSDQQKPDRP
jgi:hypothetical protein